MNKLYAVLYPILWFFMWIFHPWKAVGRENLPEGGALLCGNHTTPWAIQSMWSAPWGTVRRSE